MQLTFDVFSGRTNPSWQLPPIISRQLFDIVNDNGLIQRLSPALFPVRLGYRGLQIVWPPEIVVKYRVTPSLDLPVDAFDHLVLFRELAAIARFVGFFGLDEFQRLVRLIIELLQKRASSSAPNRWSSSSIVSLTCRNRIVLRLASIVISSSSRVPDRGMTT